MLRGAVVLLIRMDMAGQAHIMTVIIAFT